MTDLVEKLRDNAALFIFQGGSVFANSLAALVEERDTLSARVAELENHSKSALVRFAECKGYDENNPIERLRFYCSLAMTGRDWLDVEQFFDALKASQGSHNLPLGEPVGIFGGKRYTPEHTTEFWGNLLMDDVKVGDLLYTSAPTIPEVDWLSNVIRSVDGNNTLGAGILA